MTDHLKIALAQLNPTVGDVDDNADKVLAARASAAAEGADLLVTSELVINGYPPDDLVLRPAFQEQVEAAVDRLAKATGDGGPAMIVGASHRKNGDLHNAVYLLDEGVIKHVRLKYDLPNYGVFDEKRVFKPGPLPGPIPFRDVRLGVMVCEDMWTGEVTECLAESAAEILIVPNGSPFDSTKTDERLAHAVARVTESDLPLIYVNQVGGQDELVFDGASFVLDADRSLKVQMPAWEETVALTSWRRDGDSWTCEPGVITPEAGHLENIYRAMVMGLADYVGKNGFPGVLIGMSGGIDSALSAAVAADALGPERVHCVMMPSAFTSQASLDDAAGCAEMLGVRLDTVSITPAVGAFDTMLADMFAGTDPNEAEENIQARARGMTLMALSNKFGSMVLSTGNKSEMSVGYATLYGDMCGGYSVLKDVYKTTVYELSAWRNQTLPDGVLGPAGRVIPENIITKAPTAELKPDQTDQDSLPPYDVLDDILRGLIEGEETFEQVQARGHDRELVKRIWNMLLRAEYKRRQAPPGVKITTRAFGRERRYPITNRFRS